MEVIPELRSSYRIKYDPELRPGYAAQPNLHSGCGGETRDI